MEVDAVELRAAPAGVTVHRLQVTDPDAPMTNAFEAQRLTARVDALELLDRRLIIDELTGASLRFGTERATSGAIRRVPGDERAPRLRLPELSVADPEAILAREARDLLRAIREDLEALRGARAGLTEELTELRAGAQAVREAPAADAQRLASKYALTPDGLANLAETGL